MFKKIALLAVTGALVITSTGCAGIAFSSHKTPLGGLYTQASSNEIEEQFSRSKQPFAGTQGNQIYYI